MYSVKPLTKKAISGIQDYWAGTDTAYLKDMGADKSKLPDRASFGEMLQKQLNLPLKEKSAYATIWYEGDTAIGHCNLNQIVYGDSAYMHLHLWQKNTHKKGIASLLVPQSLAIFFEDMQLKKIYCAPYALNPAPNKTLEKLGFRFVKRHTTTPGYINFEQEVNLWVMAKENFLQMR